MMACAAGLHACHASLKYVHFLFWENKVFVYRSVAAGPSLDSINCRYIGLDKAEDETGLRGTTPTAIHPLMHVLLIRNYLIIPLRTISDHQKFPAPAVIQIAAVISAKLIRNCLLNVAAIHRSSIRASADVKTSKKVFFGP